MTTYNSKSENSKQHHRSRRPALPPGGGFFPISFEEQCVKTLHGAIYRRFKINKDVRGWERSFSLMLQYDRVAQQQLKRVLVWYHGHIGEPMVPLVEEAKEFRNRFVKLEQAMLRALAEMEQPASHVAQEIVSEQLTELGWPKGSRSQLLGVVQATLDNSTVFNEKYERWRLRAVRAAQQEDETDIIWPGEGGLHERATYTQLLELDALLHALTFLLRRPERFTVAWITYVNMLVLQWADWSGALAPFTFTATHKEFLRIGSEIAESHFGAVGERFWRQFLKEIDEN